MDCLITPEDLPGSSWPAKVGGIQANNSYPADFLLDNLKSKPT